MARPPASVIVPFVGSDAELERLLGALGRLELNGDDEVIVADNRPGARVAPSCGPIKLIDAAGLQTPASARNRGAAAAANGWLVFIDADTSPSPTLLHDLFAPLPASGTAILAGEIVDVAGSGAIAARHAAARRHLSQRATLERSSHAYAQSANIAVRTRAFAQVGGFIATARAGEDADLCFRLERAGWQLEYRPRATVSHLSRDSVPAAMLQLARHGSGAAWLERRYPGAMPAAGPTALARRLARSTRTAIGAAARRDREQAAFALLDIAGTVAFEVGRLLPNQPRKFWRHQPRGVQG